MLSGTIRVFHESKNTTLALRGSTQFENIRRRESHFSQKITLKNRHFHLDKRCILENECSVAHFGVPRVQKRHSFLTRLHPLREHSPTGITLFAKNHPISAVADPLPPTFPALAVCRNPNSAAADPPPPTFPALAAYRNPNSAVADPPPFVSCPGCL